MSGASSELGIRFTGDTTSADAAAARTEQNLKKIGATAQQTNREIANANTGTQRMADQTAASMQKTAEAAAQAGRDLVDAGRAAANGDWASAAQNIGKVGEAAGVSRMTLVGWAATLGIAAAAVTTLYRAYEGGVAEVDNMTRAIELSGNYAGQTRASMRSLALEMSSFSSNVRESKDTVTALAGSGLIASQSFESVARLVGEYASATKRSVDEVRPELVKLFEDPARGAQTLNQSMHFLTAAELEHIRTMQESGREGEAQLLLSEKLREAVAKHETQLGLIDSALKTVKNSWAAFWDAALAVGRPQSLEEKIATQRAAVEGLSKSLSPTAGRKQVAASGLLSQLEAQRDAENDAAWAASFKAQQEKNRVAWGELAKNYRSNAERAAEEMRKAKQLAINSGMSLDDPSVKKVLAEIQDKYKDKAPKTTDYDRLSERVKDYAAQLDLAAEKGDKVTQGDKLYIDVQRQLSSAQQASLQPLLDHIKAREQAADAVKKQTAAEASLLQIRSLEQSFQRDLEGRRLQMQDMPALDRQRMADQIAIEEKSRATRDQLARQLQRNEITPELYAQGMDRLTEAVDRQKGAISDLYDQQIALNGSWEKGARSGLTTYVDYASNAFAQTRDLTVNAFRGMEDALANFVTTGKLDFSSLANSIIADIARMQFRAAAADLFKSGGGGGMFSGLLSLFGGSSGSNSVMGIDLSSSAEDVFASAKGNIFPSGTDLAAYRNTIVSSPTLFRFAQGGAFRRGLMGEDPSSPGEAIMPLVRTSSGHLGVRSDSGGSAPQVFFNVTNQGTPQRYEQQGMSWDGEKLVVDIVATDIERDGPISQALGRNYGLSKGAGAR